MSRKEKIDVVIIGGGPAGISAAVWCSDLGLSSTILEVENRLFGQLHRIHNPITNYLGATAKNGEQLIEKFKESIDLNRLRAENGVSIAAVDCERKTITLTDEREFVSRAIFIATGVRRRTLGVPGEDRLQGKGILRSGADEKASVRGKRVVVVGGGDAAAENALILADFAERVYLVHRREELTARAEFRERIASQPKIHLELGSNVSEVGGRDRVEFVRVKSADGRESRLDAEHFIARIGVVANSELFLSQVEHDPSGYLKVDSECRTSLRGVYAIGDVASPSSPTIATAVGMGATAAKSVNYLLTRKKTV